MPPAAPPCRSKYPEGTSTPPPARELSQASVRAQACRFVRHVRAPLHSRLLARALSPSAAHSRNFSASSSHRLRLLPSRARAVRHRGCRRAASAHAELAPLGASRGSARSGHCGRYLMADHKPGDPASQVRPAPPSAPSPSSQRARTNMHPRRIRLSSSSAADRPDAAVRNAAQAQANRNPIVASGGGCAAQHRRTNKPFATQTAAALPGSSGSPICASLPPAVRRQSTRGASGGDRTGLWTRSGCQLATRTDECRGRDAASPPTHIIRTRRSLQAS